jgi:hypothetical protein
MDAKNFISIFFFETSVLCLCDLCEKLKKTQKRILISLCCDEITLSFQDLMNDQGRPVRIMFRKIGQK